jgi:hypothetical protein
MEDALKRLDRLTQEEARMAITENMRATHAVDERVKGVREQVLVVDDRVANVNHKVAEVIHGMEQTANEVDEVKRLSSLNLISTDYKALHSISENQLRESIHKWLSPPDPSTNHNIACDTHHKKTATWFFEGNMYQEWKSKSSLLWIHGKRAPYPKFTSGTVPSERLDIVAGSGKSIIWFVDL